MLMMNNSTVVLTNGILLLTCYGQCLLLFVHTCSVHHVRHKLGVHTLVDTGTFNYSTKYTTKMKTKFSYCDQIKLNEV